MNEDLRNRSQKSIELGKIELELELTRSGLRQWAAAMNEIKTDRLHETEGLTWEQYCAKQCPQYDMEIVEAMIAIGLSAPPTEN